ncbi:hypothetical protein [Burkholderia ubonensis]|uniref:hypothetical protein n=1 Tax=Burkholderia ubonensis TaxID=101571 RepID=UPI0018DFEBCE|nr:hypothetical protein [Burkholderia ubonensis]
MIGHLANSRMQARVDKTGGQKQEQCTRNAPRDSFDAWNLRQQQATKQNKPDATEKKVCGAACVANF